MREPRSRRTGAEIAVKIPPMTGGSYLFCRVFSTRTGIQFARKRYGAASSDPL